MLTRIPNETGVISYNRNALDDIIRKAFSQCKEQCRIASRLTSSAKEMSYSEKGVYVKVCCIVRVGTPIMTTLEEIISSIAADITDCLELPIDNIILNVVAVAASKNTEKRNITLDYYSNYVNADDDSDGSED